MGTSEFAAVEAIRDAIPTSRHAQMLFDMVVSRLGAAAVVETRGDGSVLDLHRKVGGDDVAIVPWPLLRMNTKGRLSTILPLSGPEGESHEPPVRGGTAPKLRNLGPGELIVYDGADAITVTYGDDGRWFETTRSENPDAQSYVLRALTDRPGQATELLAAYVAELDIARHGPAFVLRPAPFPGGVATAWSRGLLAARTALFDRHVPADARWIVVDGFAGRALVWGETRERALETWRRMIAHEQPKPDHADEPPPEPEENYVKPIEAPPEGFGFAMRISGPTADVPWPAFIPENTPAVVIQVDRCRHEPPSPWTWIRLLGNHGQTVHALVQHREEGCLLVGGELGLSGVIDLDALEGHLDDVGYTWKGPGGDRPELKSELVQYRFVDDRTKAPVTPAFVAGRRSTLFSMQDLDGEVLRWQALRQRWL